MGHASSRANYGLWTQRATLGNPESDWDGVESRIIIVIILLELNHPSIVLVLMVHVHSRPDTTGLKTI